MTNAIKCESGQLSAKANAARCVHGFTYIPENIYTENRYTLFTVQGHPARKYDNRVTVIGADLKEVDLGEWLK